MIRKFGLIGPDKRDDRDKLLAFSRRLKLPLRYSVKDRCVPLPNQDNLGSCVFNGGIFLGEYNDRNDGDNQWADLSRLMLYYQTRLMYGMVNEDCGAYIRDMIKVFAKFGTCREFLWPYDVSRFADPPPEECYRDALNYRIRAYHRIVTLFDIKACLASGWPFIMGIPIFPSFDTDEVRITGKVSMPNFWEDIEGYHAIDVVGFDDKTGRVECANWWGLDWGNKGYFTLPYEYLEEYVIPQGQGDCWTIIK